MSSYSGNQRNDRAKAAAAVILVHIAIGAAILSGLNVETVTKAVERLKTFDIREEVPPPPEPPPPVVPDESSAPKDEAAPANIESKPTPVVAPPPRMPPPIPLPTAQVQGPEGSDRTAGAADRPGTGTGAGGQGQGFGGGGSGGTGSGRGIGREASLIGGHRGRLSRSFLREVGISRGQVPLQLGISVNGRVTSCRPLRSSGSERLDQELCRIMTSRSRWRPATDTAGKPIPVELTYVSTFSE